MESFNSAVLASVDALLKSLIQAIEQICLSDLKLHKDQQNPAFLQFLSTLTRGVDLVNYCGKISPLNIFCKCRYASKILNLEKEINGFVGCIPEDLLVNARKLVAELKDLYTDLKPPDICSTLNESICKQAFMLTNDACINTMRVKQIRLDNFCESAEIEEAADTLSYHNTVAVKSQFYVGLEKSIGNLKELLLKSEVSVVGVHCMEGCGKTTLALALCDDPHINDYFETVIFITVSQSPNLKQILETIWEKIVGRDAPKFQNVENARIQLQQQLKRQSKRTLVMLDDVWSRANSEKLLFEAPGYKTLITSRDSSTIPRNHSTRLYQLPLLGQKDALSLFCYSAFGKTSIPSTADSNLVMKVQAECKGLPLALKVIGSSLQWEPHISWESALKKLSNGEPISRYQKQGLRRCLEISIGFLDDVGRKCFLDLASFPEDQKICVDALLDIWVYVRKMEWRDAFIMLLEFANRNILNLISNPGSQATISYGNASELCFSQHGVLQNLAMYLGSQDSLVHSKSLLMPRKGQSLPGKWELLNDRSFNAQIVSVHTGSMAEKQWFEMNFQETEVLVLLFSASEYFLPPFLRTMKKLKFLIVCNLSSKKATIKGLGALTSFPQLRSIRLENLVAPTTPKQSKVIQNMDRLSLSLSEGFANISSLNDANLQGFYLEHCSNLEELPPAIFQMPSAQIWSVTNPHLVEKLPYDLGNLTSLRMLRLSALPGLKELPSSIGKLGQLEFLDISLCEGLKELPEEIGQLKKLKEINMRQCSSLRTLPRSICGLCSLKHVICDEKVGHQWLRAKTFSIPDLRVEIVEAQSPLGWLDD